MVQVPSQQAWADDRSSFGEQAGAGAGAGPLAAQFAALTGSLLQVKSVADVLKEVVTASLALMPHVDVVSVTLRTRTAGFHTPIYTDPVAATLDELQYEFAEGPCIQAAELNGPAMAECYDLAKDLRWPRFSDAAVRLGVSAVMSTTLHPEALPVESGSLNFYSRHSRGFDDRDRTAGLLLATHASLALAHSTAVTLAELEADQLHHAIDSRDVIGQAKGILMARQHLTADQAFDRLRQTSQQLNVKLVEISQNIAANPDLLTIRPDS